MDDSKAPEISSISECYKNIDKMEHTGWKFNSRGIRYRDSQNLVIMIDLEDCAFSDDACDFDRSFLRLLDVSLAQYGKSYSSERYQTKLDNDSESYISRKRMI